MEDIKLFFSELFLFVVRKLHLSFWRFEKGKGFMVEALYRQRGKFARRFVHTGMAALAGLGMIIAPTLAKEFPAFDFISFDKSKKALKIAKKNQKELNVNNVNFIHSSDFSFIKKRKFDFFFSNPPYIKQDEINALQKEITSFEPRLALDGGEDGLDFYKFIAKNIRTYLTPYASIFLEIGHTQRKEVEKIFKNEAFSLLKCKKDYSNLDRILIFN